MTNYIKISEKLEKTADLFFLGMNSSNWVVYSYLKNYIKLIISIVLHNYMLL